MVRARVRVRVRVGRGERGGHHLGAALAGGRDDDDLGGAHDVHAHREEVAVLARARARVKARARARVRVRVRLRVRVRVRARVRLRVRLRVRVRVRVKVGVSDTARLSLPAITTWPVPVALISGVSGKRQPQWPSGPVPGQGQGWG